MIFTAASPAGPASPAQHLGVASCAASTCHGSTRPLAVHGITQDEYFTWQRQDRHAQAWNTLATDRSDAIAAQLGWGPAREAPGCLSCHADMIPPASRGPRYLVSDGVGCEACHGGAEPWLASHVQGFRTHTERTAHGLTPLWEPARRAHVCGACHQGDGQHVITHAMMAAGHPPLLFELDTYTALQPAHYQADADYAARKGEQDAARNWLAGQVTAAQLYLDQLGAAPRSALFPELALFDCSACHHGMSAGRASTARNQGMPRGTVPLADSALLLVSHWLHASHPQAAAGWNEGIRRLYRAAEDGDSQQLGARARQLRQQADALRSELERPLDSAQVKALLLVLLDQAALPLRGDFSYAQQSAMGASVLLSALRTRGAIAVDGALQQALDDLYAAVRDRDAFAPDAWSAAVARLRARVAAG